MKDASENTRKDARKKMWNKKSRAEDTRRKTQEKRCEIWNSQEDARGGGELWGEGREKEKIVTTNLGTAETEKVRRRSTIQLQRFDDGHEQNSFDQIEPNGIEQIE